MLPLHLNCAWIDIAAKEFADFPQSHAFVYTTGDQERPVGSEIEGINGYSVKLNVDSTKRFLTRRAEPLV